MNKLRLALTLFFISLLGVLFFTYLSSNKSRETYVDITSDDLKSYLDEDRDIYLLDVHIPEQTHISGTDDFIPFNEIEDNAARLPKDKNTEMVVYCRSGSMSRTASDALIDLGYKNVKNLVGGINAWKVAGYGLGDEHKTVDYNKPVAETHKNTHDFGQILKEDGIVSVVFEIENHGKQPLEIGEISTSCGCTSAEVVSSTLGFNEETDLTVYFDPNFHEEPQGKFTRSVFVKTNDPDLPEMQFDIHVEILE